MVRVSRAQIVPAAGGGPHFPAALKHIRLARYGCANRPFYHIVVAMHRRHQHEQPIEQLGTYDPLSNQRGEKLVSLNIERLRYWLSHNTELSRPVAMLFGLSGLLPMNPLVYIRAWENRARVIRERSNTSGKDGHEDQDDGVQTEQENPS